ncbi:MAG: ParB/RepB/Spo0J family partition protein [Clostridia bacterium]
MKKGGLGKGLDLIFQENTQENQNVLTLKINEIEPNRAQPRKNFEQESLQELADSILEHGIIQPILVRPTITGTYQIVAGERRWRASRMAGLTEIPVLIKEIDDTQYIELALIENLQREDLNPVEESLAYSELIKEHGYTQEQVAKAVGKSRPAVANSLRLLSLPEEISELLKSGTISAGHARTLLAIEDKEEMILLAEYVVQNEINVRQLEKLIKNRKSEKQEPIQKIKNVYYSETEIALNTHLGRKVKVNGTDKKGTLQIEFYGENDLQELLALMNMRD